MIYDSVYQFIDDEDDELENIKNDENSNSTDKYDDINELANKILLSDIDDDEFFEDYDNESNVDDENDNEEITLNKNDNDDIESDTQSTESDFEISSNNQLINDANKILELNKKGGKKNNSNLFNNNDSENNLFGEYEIIYTNKVEEKEKNTKLIENASINECKYDDVEKTISKIKSKIDKYKEERDEIQKFLSFSNQEIKISETRSLIEACLFVLGSDGLNVYDIKKVTNLPLGIINNILDEMVEYYSNNINSGICLMQYGNKYKFVSKKEYFDKIGSILNKKERKPLSDSTMETLAIIAYNQPCTKSTIEKIRNKNCFANIQRLEELGLIEAQERSDAIGKPWLYTLTQKFFDLYGIKSLSELPPISRSDKNYQNEVDESNDFVDELVEER